MKTQTLFIHALLFATLTIAVWYWRDHAPKSGYDGMQTLRPERRALDLWLDVLLGVALGFI